MQDWKNISKVSPEKVIEIMMTSPLGLSEEEAIIRRKKDGENIISELKKRNIILVFLSNFIHLMAVLLWIAGTIAIFAGMPQLGIAVYLVNLINGSFSFWQEYRAGKATEALKDLLPSYSLVVRDGITKKILSKNLVRGDIILLEEGDKISADARIIESNDLQVNQSTLTGESNNIRKTKDAINKEDINKSDVPNFVFAGTTVSEGNAKAIVLEIGMKTEFGKIAGLTQFIKEETSPLQKELNRLTKQISIIAIGFGIFFFVAGVLFVKEPIAEAFIFALGMIVAFIPEGLLPTVTLSLAKAVQRMSKRNALVKKLSSVETLGSTTVICTDKTGTLTQNEMTVISFWVDTKEYEVTGVGYSEEGSILYEKKEINVLDNSDLHRLIKGMALCNNSKLITSDKNRLEYNVIGDPTEACLLVLSKKAGIDILKENQLEKRIRELPFESRRKMMTTIHSVESGSSSFSKIAYIKGAPKEVLSKSEYYLKDGEVLKMTEEFRKLIMEQNDKYARNGLRVLALSYKEINSDERIEYNTVDIEKDLVFTGLVAMFDPPRAEVLDAVSKCFDAGIKIIMITGDYGLTAESIARRIGIIKGDNLKVVSGMELEKITDDLLKEYLKGDIIFARVAPEQKLRVVTCLQEMGEIVAVTGDGVNDAPALKKADIGVAMGISGTDVAKEAADMILTDDNFASIVHAVEEGRAVYSNIRKFMLYILNSNVPEAVPSAMFLFSRGVIPLPLTIMQILTIDLGTDMLPAIGLGSENPERGIMKIPPRKKEEKLLNKNIIIKAFLWYGVLGAFLSAVSYFYVNIQNGWPEKLLASGEDVVYYKATAMALAAIVFTQIGAVFNCRTEKESVFKAGIFKNKQVIYGIIFEVFLIVMLVYLPLFQKVFHTAALSLTDWLLLCIWPIVIVLLEEIRKYFIRKRGK